MSSNTEAHHEGSPRSRYRSRVDLVEFFFFLLPHVRGLILAALIGAFLAGSYAAFLAPRRYAATARLYVRGIEQEGLTYSGLQTGTLLALDYPEALQSWEVQALVIDRLDLDCGWEALASMLEIDNAANSRVLRITVRNRDAALAAAIANAEAQAVRDYLQKLLGTSGAELLSAAAVPTRAEGMGLAAHALLGASAGLVLALLVLFLRFALDDSPHTPEDILEACGLETWAVLPRDGKRRSLEEIGDE